MQAAQAQKGAPAHGCARGARLRARRLQQHRQPLALALRCNLACQLCERCRLHQLRCKAQPADIEALKLAPIGDQKMMLAQQNPMPSKSFRCGQAAGGTIVKDIFSFPGGRRFQFTDPDGYELAVWSE